MAIVADLAAIFWSLLDPWRFMLSTLPFLFATTIRLVRTRQYAILLQWCQFQDAWFSSFWLWFGPQLRAGNGDRITALLEGRITNAHATDMPVAPHVSGIVLDIGPGRGFWVDLYKKSKVPIGSNAGIGAIQKVYGVEPNPDSFVALARRTEEIGLTGVYQALPVGIESLDQPNGIQGGIEKESVDCIVSILCLCSIPRPEENIKELYSYLKKGGRWYLYEHVSIRNSWFMELYQRFVNIFWPVALGGCDLCRDTEQYLRQAGSWTNIDLAQPADEPWHQTVPHILGILTK